MTQRTVPLPGLGGKPRTYRCKGRFTACGWSATATQQDNRVDIRGSSRAPVTYGNQRLLSGCAERVHSAEETPWSTAIQVL
jgi:hypothetical protein